MRGVQQKPLKPARNFDFNKPVNTCIICYTLSGWHCYECGNDFCEAHFHTHKEKNLCTKASGT